jgi:uncharacterized membrane protein
MLLLTITSGMMTDMIGYVSTVFGDLSPIILLIVGVSVAMLVISMIIRAFSR